MTPTKYSLEKISDLLAIPSDRLGDCLRDLRYAILVAQISFSDDAVNLVKTPFIWTDDGDPSATIFDQSNEPFIKFKVDKDGPA